MRQHWIKKLDGLPDLSLDEKARARVLILSKLREDRDAYLEGSYAAATASVRALLSINAGKLVGWRKGSFSSNSSAGRQSESNLGTVGTWGIGKLTPTSSASRISLPRPPGDGTQLPATPSFIDGPEPSGEVPNIHPWAGDIYYQRTRRPTEPADQPANQPAETTGGPGGETVEFVMVVANFGTNGTIAVRVRPKQLSVSVPDSAPGVTWLLPDPEESLGPLRARWRRGGFQAREVFRWRGQQGPPAEWKLWNGKPKRVGSATATPPERAASSEQQPVQQCAQPLQPDRPGGGPSQSDESAQPAQPAQHAQQSEQSEQPGQAGQTLRPRCEGATDPGGDPEAGVGNLKQ